MDYVDLYQFYRFDPTTPIEETIEALHDVVKAGKALVYGASSMNAGSSRAICIAHKRWARHVSCRCKTTTISSIVRKSVKCCRLCRAEGIAVIPWSPLARGFLAGNRRRQDHGETARAKRDAFAHTMYYDDCDFAVVDRVTEIATKRGVSNAQIALAWLLHQPGVTAPIVGASKSHHLADAVAAAALKLDDSELKALSEPYRPHRVLGHN